ncbi:unnamed protein product [Closterium sp. NIES-65]|nr:unnamed protein product [Closterium sp. NIES-65]
MNWGYYEADDTDGPLRVADGQPTEREERIAGTRRAALKEASAAVDDKSLSLNEKSGLGETPEARIVLKAAVTPPPLSPPPALSPAISPGPSAAPSPSAAPVVVWADEQAGAELNALLAFKASVIDFQNALRSWVVPRHAANSSLSPAAFFCRWRFVSCSKPTAPKAVAAGAAAGAAASRSVIALQIPEPGLNTSAGGVTEDLGILLSSTLNVTTSIATSLANSTSDGGSSSSSAAIPPLLPQEFSSLTALETLTIRNSADFPVIAGLAGAFPTQLSACYSLSKLELAFHRMIGGIPDSISQIKGLKELSLRYNLITGTLPTGIFALLKLESLKLPGNAISGPIPPQISLLSKTLMNLELFENHLSSSLPEEIGQLKKLGVKPDFAGLALRRNNFSGSLPASISALQSLQNLDLSYNQFSGSLPQGGAFLSGFSKLVTLQIYGNHFSGSLPLSFACTTSILTITLGSNQFWGTLPGNLDTCAMMLLELDVSSNNLTGPLPPSLWKSLSAAYMLGTLTLSNNSFTGSLSPAFAVATLGQFDASNNKLSGPLPDLKACAVATVLQGVFLANNSFTGSIPPGFICKQMLSLDLRNNSLSGDLPDVLVGLNSKQIPSAAVLKASPHFAQLNLSHNSFTGPIPLGGNCKDLTQLFLDHNNFSGPAAPEALATCRNIIYYDASNNQLSGTAADVVDKLSKSLAVVGVRLGGNRIEGEIPDNIYTLSSIRELNLSGNVLAGSIPSTVASLNRLQVLDVSGNGLSSSLPSSLGTLSYLSLLDVSRNGLSGPIPPELAPPFLPFLTLLNVSHNAFSGAIPFGFSNTNTTATALDFSYNNLSGPIYPGNLSLLPASAFAANPALCGGAGYPDCPAPPGQALSTGAVVGIVVACVAALALAVGGVWYALFYQRSTGLEGGTMLVFERLDFKLNIRSILDATDTFSNKYLLGRGGFGSVYKATLADGRDVAIKRLALGSSQGQREFEAEMHTLGAVRHRNLVVLVAAYLSRPPSQERLLIYDFLPGGSLDHVLDRDMPKGSPMRRWEPANVLLDDNFEPKVADFGLAREMDATKSHMSTAVFGTIGYLAPEYYQRGRLSYKSDVFAFGVLVLQVITGKLPTDEEFAERGLARWVGANSIANIVDRRIDDREEYMDEMKGVVTLGLRCTSRVAADRPSMAEALELLEELSAFAEGIGGGKKEEAGGGEGKQQE